METATEQRIVKEMTHLAKEKLGVIVIQSQLIPALVVIRPTEAHALLNVRMNKPRRTVKRGKHLPSVVKTTAEPGSANVSNINSCQTLKKSLSFLRKGFFLYLAPTSEIEEIVSPIPTRVTGFSTKIVGTAIKS